MNYWLVGLVLALIVFLLALWRFRCTECGSAFALEYKANKEEFAEQDVLMYTYTIRERQCRFCGHAEFAVDTDMPGVAGGWRQKPVDS